MFEDGGNESSLSARNSPLPTLPEADRKQLVFTEQWTRHQSSVRAYLASFLGNSIAVDDALQEVAMVVWRKGPWEEGDSAFLGYCLACARRIALAARRKRGDGRLELLSHHAATAVADQVAFLAHQEVSESGERMHALRICLEKISPEHRDLLFARYSGDSKSDLRELCKRGGKSMDSIYKILDRLRDLLRACIERGETTTE